MIRTVVIAQSRYWSQVLSSNKESVRLCRASCSASGIGKAVVRGSLNELFMYGSGPSRLNNRLWWILPYYVLLLIELKGLVYDHPIWVVVVVIGNQWLRQIRTIFPASTGEQVTPTDLRFCLPLILLTRRPPSPPPCPSSSLQVLIDRRQYYLHTWTALLLHLLFLLITPTVLLAGVSPTAEAVPLEVYPVDYSNPIPMVLCCVHKMLSHIYTLHISGRLHWSMTNGRLIYR